MTEANMVHDITSSVLLPSILSLHSSEKSNVLMHISLYVDFSNPPTQLNYHTLLIKDRVST